MARQHGTSGKWVGSDGRLEVIGAILGGESGAEGGSGRGRRRGSPYNHPPSSQASTRGGE